MRYIRNISDDQNKSGDTDNIFRFNLLQGEDIFNFGDYPISINIANSSGYILSMVPEKEFGNSILKLDFNDQSLKSLTPDNYLLEVEVKYPDGTTATFPTKGGMPFTVNSNLKSTTGHLVPTVTFDEVLDAVDKKVNNYLATVVKGDKGDKGDTGVINTTADYTWTGNNKFTTPIDASFKNRWYSNAFNDIKTVAKDMTNFAGFWSFHTNDVANTPFGGWSTLQVVPWYGNSSVAGVMYLKSIELNDLWYTTISLSSSNDTINWIKIADDATVVHKTGTETVSGDKTFTGNNTFTQNISGNITGNSATTTKLQTPRKVNGTNFDGTSDITVEPAVQWINSATDVFTLDNGFYYISSLEHSPNSPVNSNKFFTVEVIQTASNGFMRLIDSNGSSFWITKSGGAWLEWRQDADNSTIVHNTGTETVAGDKTFTGNNNFIGSTTLQNGNYGLRVTTSGVQKTSDGGTTWVNI